MIRKILLPISLLTLFSVNLLAVSGPHGYLGAFGGGVGNGNNGELCVYCHTPHSANTSLGIPAPLWNKPTSKLVSDMGTSYPMYGKTIAGTSTTNIPENVTLACLSCHDGVSAMNSVVNAPGTGYAGTGGATPSTDGTGGVYIGRTTPKTMVNSIYTVGYVGNALGGWNSGGLSNDHPLSIKYNEGRGSLKPVSTPLVGWLGATKISDLLRGPNRDMVHCGSCHDPHDDSNEMYRRVNNYNGSGLCFGCHDK